MALTTAVSSKKSAINAGTFCFVYFFYYLNSSSFFLMSNDPLFFIQRISFFSLSMLMKSTSTKTHTSIWVFEKSFILCSFFSNCFFCLCFVTIICICCFQSNIAKETHVQLSFKNSVYFSETNRAWFDSDF